MTYYYERLQGWSEFTALYRRWVREASPGSRFVEVGIWRGRSTIAMAEFIRESGKRIEFTAVDHFQGSEEHQAELEATGDDLMDLFDRHARAAGVRELIHLIPCASVEAAQRVADLSCDLVYLDASHDAESVAADIHAWWPKVKHGGHLAGHDWGGNWPGVTRAVTEFVQREGLPLEELGSTWTVRKP